MLKGLRDLGFLTATLPWRMNHPSESAMCNCVQFNLFLLIVCGPVTAVTDVKLVMQVILFLNSAYMLLIS
jgi:hypothetical protein